MYKSSIRAFLVAFISFALSGCLPVLFTGAASSVAILAKDRSAGEAASDIKIATAIKASFVRSNFTRLYTAIKVDVIKGRVLLTGMVEKEDDSIEAVKIVWAAKGVVEVINELKLNKKGRYFDLIQYTRDMLTTSQIKSQTIINRDIKFINYTIITLNDVVYLFGLARSEAELASVASIASNVGRVQKVVSHVRIQPVAGKTKRGTKENSTKENRLLLEQKDEDLGQDEGAGDEW
ncbi:MAG: BON domain-containing protein [Rickettsiales bacterium]|nr:MAG: BON domain-containing protein [Rickettsiales bacterium]